MTPPTDLELMMFHDGELDESRHGEVEAFLTAGGSASTKLAGLSLATALLVENHVKVSLSQQKQADSIADLVMSQIAKEPAARVSEKAPAERRELRAANDNGRFILGLAGLAAAAAAALFVWGRSAPPEIPSAALTAPVEQSAPEVALTQPSVTTATLPTATEPLATLPIPPEEESSPSVEVASVDFSARSGALYYVPSDSKGQTTAVVWLKDE